MKTSSTLNFNFIVKNFNELIGAFPTVEGAVDYLNEIGNKFVKQGVKKFNLTVYDKNGEIQCNWGRNY